MINIPEMITELLVSENEPRVHGNGFLQLDLPDGRRLHVWDESLPKQKVSSSIHDHAFAFKSTVLTGELTHVVYDAFPNPAGGYDVLAPVRTEGTEDTKLEPTGERMMVFEEFRKTIRAGGTYRFEPQKFHDTICNTLTATIIEKLYRLDVEPRILIPHGESPDNEFDREAFNPDLLWSVIFRALLEAANEENLA